MRGELYGVLRLQGITPTEPGWGTLPTFVRSGGRVVAYSSEIEAAAVAAKDRARLKVCPISPEVEARSGVVVIGGATA